MTPPMDALIPQSPAPMALIEVGNDSPDNALVADRATAVPNLPRSAMISISVGNLLASNVNWSTAMTTMKNAPSDIERITDIRRPNL